MPAELPILLLSGVALALAAVAALSASLFTVEQGTVAVVQRLGRFRREVGPGLHARVPLLDQVSGRVSLRARMIDLRVETRTEDDVCLFMAVAVQFTVLAGRARDAFYSLEDAPLQLTSFALDAIRARVPRVTLDELYGKKDELAGIIRGDLAQSIEKYGYGVERVLITDIDPDVRIKEAMNEQHAARRSLAAAADRAEAARVVAIKAAEWEAEHKVLQGRSVIDQRQAIALGLRDAINEFCRGVPGATALDVMNLVLSTQYFDLFTDIGAAPRIVVERAPAQGAVATEFRGMSPEFEATSNGC